MIDASDSGAPRVCGHEIERMRQLLIAFLLFGFMVWSQAGLLEAQTAPLTASARASCEALLQTRLEEPMARLRLYHRARAQIFRVLPTTTCGPSRVP